MQSQGVTLALVGLSLQVFTIVLFCGFFVDYIVRYLRSVRGSGHIGTPSKISRRVYLFFGFMGLAVLLILLRCVYRLVELHEGYKGALVRDEVMFIVLEGAVIISAVYCLMIGHPGFVFRWEAEQIGRSSSQLELSERRDQ